MAKSMFSFLNIFGKTKKRSTMRKRRGTRKSRKTRRNRKNMRGGWGGSPTLPSPLPSSQTLTQTQ